jgi:hypothetical protein
MKFYVNYGQKSSMNVSLFKYYSYFYIFFHLINVLQTKADLNSKKRLALFYLANDVIQNCKRKNAKIFQDTFKQHLYEAIALSK